MTDEKIIEALETFDIPVGNKRMYENELDGKYHYFIFRRARLNSSGCGRYTRKIAVVYVYEGEQKISDFSVINKMEELGLNFEGMDNDEIQLASTNDWIDMNTYTFSRPERG